MFTDIKAHAERDDKRDGIRTENRLPLGDAPESMVCTRLSCIPAEDGGASRTCWLEGTRKNSNFAINVFSKSLDIGNLLRSRDLFEVFADALDNYLGKKTS